MSSTPQDTFPSAPVTARTAKRRTVVVGYDGSDEARTAFAVAIERSEATGTLVVVHATPPASSWLGSPYYERAVARNHQAAERVLDEMRPLAEQVQMPIEFEVLEGSPAEVLVRAAAARAADEIVVGSRGLGRLHGALGSVSQELLREATCPVLVVGRDAQGRARQGSTSPRRIA